MRTSSRLILVCSLALGAPLLAPMATGSVWALGDLIALHFPLRYLYHQALHSGTSFLWSSAMFSGFYLHGEGQAGMAHPFHLLLYRLLPVGLAFNLELVSSYIAAFAGMWILLRRQRLSGEAALFGAMVFAFCGFNLHHLDHMNVIAVIAHLPWLLLATEVLLTSQAPRTRAFAFSSVVLLLASQLLLGFPQCVWMTMLAAALYAFYLFRQGAAGSRLGLLGGAALLGCAVAGVQWLPSYDTLEASVRHAPSLAFRLTYSLHPGNLLQLWSPYTLVNGYIGPPNERGHEFGVYAGAFCTVGLAWLLVRWRALERRGLAAALLVFAALSVVMTLGRYGGLYLLIARVPGLSGFRAPARHIVLLQFALSGLASLVFHDLTQLARRRETVAARSCWPLAIPAILSAVTAAAGAALARQPWAAAHGLALNGAIIAARGPVLMLATAWLVLLAARGIRWSIPALVVLTAFDLGLWGYQNVSDARMVPAETLASLVEVPPDARPGDAVMPKPDTGLRSLMVLDGLRVRVGDVGMPPRSTFDPSDVLADRITGVTWRRAPSGWARVPDTMPRARLVSEVRASTNVPADAAAVDISRVALVRDPIDVAPGRPGEARVVDDRPGRIAVDVSASTKQLLVLTERFHEGWRAAADDGLTCPIVPVYGDYLSCVVEPGAHRITFNFSPASLRNGLALTGVGLLLTIISSALVLRG